MPIARTKTDDLLFAEAIADMEDDWVTLMRETGLMDDARAILARIEQKYDVIADTICPAAADIFAFARFPLANARVVIIGQDPYPNRAHACGLAFSVPNGIPVPASLRNIFGALVSQQLMPRESARNGDLSTWCQQGVILLNTALTTIAGKSGAHVDEWAPFTRKLAAEIGRAHPGLVYLLFGKTARALASQVPSTCAYLEWSHPSPLCRCNQDALNPENFVNCPHFRVANNMIQARGDTPINWDPSARDQRERNNRKRAPTRELTTISGSLEKIMLDPDDDLVCPDERTLYAFVDGAARANGKKNASAGYAVAVFNSIEEYLIVGTVEPSATAPPTNNRAELMALRDLFALVSTENFIRDVRDMPLHIVYDSAYAAGCVREWYEEWCAKVPQEIKANLDIISVAHDFRARVEAARTITWEKVKSHTREPARDADDYAWYKWRGNKLVDALASAKN